MTMRRLVAFLCLLVSGSVFFASGCGLERGSVIDADSEAGDSVAASAPFESFDGRRCGELSDLESLLARSADFDEDSLSLCGAIIVADAFTQGPVEAERLRFATGEITAEELNRLAAQTGESAIAIGELSQGNLRAVFVDSGLATFEPSRSPGPDFVRRTTGLLFFYRADLKSQETGTLLIDTDSDFAAGVVQRLSEKA